MRTLAHVTRKLAALTWHLSARAQHALSKLMYHATTVECWAMRKEMEAGGKVSLEDLD